VDTIRIEGLKIFAHHGVFDFEKENGQDFYVNAVLKSDLRKAGKSDKLEDSTNYGEVCHFITGLFEKNRHDLIEAVAENVAQQILLQFPLIQEIELEVCKPQAPIGLPFSNVSVKIERKWHSVYLALGSNMGERESYIKQGIEELKKDELIKVEKVSTLIETEPYGGVEQDKFLNGASFIKTLYTPEELLEKLHEIEALADRKRTIHWGPRTLDLDILFYDDLIYHSDSLCIPHQDMANRSFVLIPMAEIAPYFHHPITGKTMEQMQAEK